MIYLRIAPPALTLCGNFPPSKEYNKLEFATKRSIYSCKKVDIFIAFSFFDDRFLIDKDEFTQILQP